MNDQITKAFEGHNIRIITDQQGEPWFVAKDIAIALGYRDAANMTRNLKVHQQGTRNVSTPGGVQVMAVINEPGIYRAVLKSRIESAERFQDWVTDEVLPSIRKHGESSMTNLSIISSTEMTMGTREIAEMLGKQHTNIKISAERLAASGVIGGGLALQETPYVHEQNALTYTEYRLNKRDSLVLVAQNSPEFTARIVDRWQELEAKQAPQIPQTYAAALLEAGRLAMELDQAQATIAIQAPKAEFADRVAGDDKGINIGNYARAVGLGQNVLFRALREHRILMSGGNRHNLPFQDYIERGYFTVKEGIRTHNDEIHPTFTPMVTGKGQQWLTKRLVDLGYLKPIAA